MMAHRSGNDSLPGSSKDRGGARLSADDLKIPIIKVLLEQGFSEQDVTLGLNKYRKRYPDHDKVIDTYVLDLVMEISKSNPKDRTSDKTLSQNKKKPSHPTQSKGSSWIDKLQPRDNKVFLRNVEIRLPQNFSRKLGKPAPKKVQTRDDEETTSTDADNEESSDENAKIKSVSIPETKSNSKSNNNNRSISASSDSSASDSEIIEVTERATPVAKKLSKKSFRFDTASNDSDSQKEQDIAKSSPCKAADKTKSGEKVWKNSRNKVQQLPADVRNKRRISNSDSNDDSLSTKQHVNKKETIHNETNKMDADQGQNEFVKPSDKAKAMLKKLKMSKVDMNNAKNFIHSVVEISPIRGVNPFQRVNVRMNSYIKDKIERESPKSSKNNVTPPQSTDSSSGNEFDSPVVSVRKYKKRKPVLSSSSSSDDIEKEKPVYKRSPRKRLKQHFDSISHVTSSQSTVQEDDLTAGSSNEFDMPETTEDKTDRNLSSMSTVCDDSDVSTICDEDSEESASLIKNKSDISSKGSARLKTPDSNNKTKSSVDDKNDEIEKENDIEDINSSSSDELPDLPFNRNSQTSYKTSQNPSIISQSKTNLKKIVSAYEQDTEKYSDYEIDSASDSDKQADKSREKQTTKQENDKLSVKPINIILSPSPNTLKNVKPLSAIPAVKSLISHSPDMYSIRSLKTSSSTSQHAKIHDTSQHAKTHDTSQHAKIHDTSQHAKTHDTSQHAKIHDTSQHAKTHDTSQHAKIHDTLQHAKTHDTSQHAKNHDTSQHAKTHDPSQHPRSYGTLQRARICESKMETSRIEEKGDSLEMKHSKSSNNHKSNHGSDELSGVTKEIPNKGSEKVSGNEETVECFDVDDASEEDNNDTVPSGQVETQNFGYTQDDDCIYVTDDSDTENIYNSLSQQVIHITDDDDDEYDGGNDMTRGDNNVSVDDRDDDSDVELSKFFDVHETDDDDDEENQTAYRNKKRDARSDNNDPEYLEIFGEDDATQIDDDDDEFDELMKGETQIVEKSPKAKESSDSTEDEIDELLQENYERKELKKHRDLSDDDEDPFDNLTRPDGNENRSMSNQSVKQVQKNGKTSKSAGNQDKKENQQDGNSKQSENRLERNVFDSILTKSNVTSRHGLYNGLTQLVTKTISSKKLAGKTLQQPRREDLYQAETQVYDGEDLDDSDEAYNVQTQVNDRNTEKITQKTHRQELYEAETQVCSDVSDNLEVYELQTQVTRTKGSDVTMVTKDYDYNQPTQVNKTTTSDEPDLAYDELTQVDHSTTLDEPDYIYNKQTQINQNAVSYHSDAEYEDPYSGLTQIDEGHHDSVKHGGGARKNSVTENIYFEATQVYRDDQDIVDPYAEATQIDSGDSSVCIVDSDSSPIKVSRVQRNVCETTVSLSDESDDAFSSLTQVNNYPKSVSNPYLASTQIDRDDNRSHSESEEEILFVKNRAVNDVAVDDTLSSSDSESGTFSLTQVGQLTEQDDLPDPYDQCTQLDNDNVFAKFASNKDSSSQQLRENRTLNRQNSSELRNKNLTPVRLSSSNPPRTGSLPSRKIIELPLQRLKTTQEKRESFRLEKEKFYSKAQSDSSKNDSDRQSTSVSLNKNMFYSKSSSSSSSTSSYSKKDNRNGVRRSISIDSKTKKRHGSGSGVQNKTKRQKVDEEPISMTQQVSKAREEMERRMYKAASNPTPVAKQKKQVTEVTEHSDVPLPTNEEIIKKGLPVLYSPQKRQPKVDTNADNFDRSSAFGKSYDNDSQSQEQPSTVTPSVEDNHQIENSDVRSTGTSVSERSARNEAEKEKYQKHNSEKKEREKGMGDLRDKDRERDKDERKKEKATNDNDRGDRNDRRKDRDRDSKERDYKHKDRKSTEKDKHSRDRDRHSNDRVERREKDSSERDTSYKRRDKEGKDSRERDTRYKSREKDYRERDREKSKSSTSRDSSDKGRERSRDHEKASSSKNKITDKEKEKVTSSRDNKDKGSERNHKDKEKEKASTTKNDKEKGDKRKEEHTKRDTNTERKQVDGTEKKSQVTVNSEVKKDSTNSDMKITQQAKTTSSSGSTDSNSANSNVKTIQQAKTTHSSAVTNGNSANSDMKTTQQTKMSSSAIINDNSVKSNTKSILKVSTTDNTTSQSKSVKFTLPDESAGTSSTGTSGSNNSSFVKSGMKTISFDAYKNRQGTSNSDSSTNKELVQDSRQISQNKNPLSSDRLNGSHVRPNTEVMQQKYGINKPNLMEKLPSHQASVHTGKENHPRLQPFVTPNPSTSLSSSSPQYQPPTVNNHDNVYAELQQKFGADYSDYFWYRLLYWNPRWLFESDLSQNAGITPPLIEAKDGKLTHIPETFDNFGDYYKIIVPHLLYEVWEMCLREWKEIQRKGLQQNFFLKVGVPHPTCPDFTYYTIDGILTKDQFEKGFVLKESFLIKLTTKAQSSTQQGQLEDFLQFGLIEKVETYHHPRQIKGVLDSSRVLAEEAKRLRKELVVVEYTVKLRTRKKKSPVTRDCVLKPVSSLVTVMRQINAMMSLPKNPLCMDVLQPGKRPSVFSELAVVTPANDRELTNYNPSQRQAICTVSMIAKLEPIQRRICLLQGPPGTGKSHTIIGIIKKIMRDSKFKSNIILCAPSNGAVDELLRRLDAAKDQHQSTGARFPLSMVRVGTFVSPELKKYSITELLKQRKRQKVEENVLPSTRKEMDRLRVSSRQLRESISCNISNKQEVNKMKADLQKMERKLHEMEKEHFTIQNSVQSPEEEWKIEQDILKNANVICGTLNSMGRQRLQTMLIGRSDGRQDRSDAVPFKCIIIDEATQASEVDCLIPLMYKCNKIIMVGDPEQLAPTILSKEATEKDFGLSLFERIYNHFKVRKDNPVLLLNTQYRMDPEIIKFTSDYVYEGRLLTDKSVIDRCRNFPLKPYILFDLLEGQEQSTSAGSISNAAEVEFTFKLCSYIMRNTKITEHRIGIIAPYQEQKALIQSALGSYKIEVGTVDGFQGREKDVIILSCVRARSTTGGIGFLNNRKRMNVAFTRAKYALYVVGHMTSLRSGGPDWKNLIDDAKERNVIYPVRSNSDFSTAVMYCMKNKRSWRFVKYGTTLSVELQPRSKC